MSKLQNKINQIEKDITACDEKIEAFQTKKAALLKAKDELVQKLEIETFREKSIELQKLGVTWDEILSIAAATKTGEAAPGTPETVTPLGV